VADVYGPTARRAEDGVRYVWNAVAALGWIFRLQTGPDVGIDAQVETVHDNKPTGRLLGIQVKSGDSYFREPTEEGWLYRGSARHLEYWLNHTMPVIVCLCDSTSGSVYWTPITRWNTTRLAAGWKVTVPREQRIDETSRVALNILAAQPHAGDVIELLIRDYLQQRYSLSAYIHPLLETPRDWHGLTHLMTVDDEIVVVGHLYSRDNPITADAIRAVLEWRDYNERACFLSPVRMLLLLVGDTVEELSIGDEVGTVLAGARDLEWSRVLFNVTPFLSLDEIDDWGRPVYYGPGGERFVTAPPPV